MVSHLDRQIDITCPLPQAALRLRHYFREHGNSDGDAMRFNLGIEINVPGSDTEVAVRRAVIATIQPAHLSADMTPRYNVQWAPEVAGPLPLFAGELLVCAGNDFDTFSLKLSGNYTPPGGHFGEGFDMVFGHRIASATADDLLQQMKREIEHAYRADEARKK